MLPTIVWGGLPGAPEWAERLARIGLDVVTSGADPDTEDTLAAAAAAVPFRPLAAWGTVRCLGRECITAEDIEGAHTVVATRGGAPVPNPNDIAAMLLERVHDNPSVWWVAAADLRETIPAVAEAHLHALVEGVQLVRLYLAKQQFD